MTEIKCVVDNGATIHDVITGEIKWSCWLDAQAVRTVVAIVLPFSTSIDYAVDWDEHVPDPATEMDRLTDTPAPYVWSILPTDKLLEVEANLKSVPTIAWWSNTHHDDPLLSAIQVTNLEASKFHGVEALRELIGNPHQHTMAIGDGNNDLPLFENAGLKIAMGNATEQLKAQADYVVGTVDQDGFAEAINRFVLS